MDKLAKTLAIRSFGRTPAIPTAVPLIGLGQVMIQGTLVASTFQKSITRTSHHNEMVEYLANKWDIDADILHDAVAWPSIAKARKRASLPFQRFISKWISEDTKQRVHDFCPRCNAPHEHLVHVLTCPHPDV